MSGNKDENFLPPPVSNVETFIQELLELLKLSDNYIRDARKITDSFEQVYISKESRIFQLKVEATIHSQHAIDAVESVKRALQKSYKGLVSQRETSRTAEAESPVEKKQNSESKTAGPGPSLIPTNELTSPINRAPSPVGAPPGPTGESAPSIALRRRQRRSSVDLLQASLGNLLSDGTAPSQNANAQIGLPSETSLPNSTGQDETPKHDESARIMSRLERSNSSMVDELSTGSEMDCTKNIGMLAFVHFVVSFLRHA